MFCLFAKAYYLCSALTMLRRAKDTNNWREKRKITVKNKKYDKKRI